MVHVMISMKDYAKKHAVSYEAVRKQVKRYEKELEGHITKKNRTQYLDDEAVVFLDARRQENPIIVQQVDATEELEHLKQENKALLVKVAEQADKIARQAEEKEAQVKLIAELEKQVLLLEVKAEKNKSVWSRLFGKE